MPWRAIKFGVPFHVWLTSPASEIIDVTSAMSLGRPKTRKVRDD
jgi:hypothetical protein